MFNVTTGACVSVIWAVPRGGGGKRAAAFCAPALPLLILFGKMSVVLKLVVLEFTLVWFLIHTQRLNKVDIWPTH